MRILIANRGEIARRIIRTAHRLGHETVAVYADPDRGAPFTQEATIAHRLGPAPLAESYLSTERLLAAAADTAATAVHPGYGFLSENGDFARAITDAGLIWIGPNPAVIDLMGSKIDARRCAQDAGVPVIPGYDASQADDELAAAAADIGFPVLIKAAAGGGGKGIRIASTPAEFAGALSEARTESKRNFGDDAVIVERYITRPRHVEVQIVGDRHGNVIDLGTRECSVQRRYQKVLEEAPAPNLSDTTRTRLRDTARALGQAVAYDSAGTVEFVVDDETGDGFFLEMNTRLQVEHPVTEMVTGLDLVALQIRSAAGDPLELAQADVTLTGHAFEARINAEDPHVDFAPQIGRIDAVTVPAGVRWDSGIEAGSTISPHYDSMVAKLICGGADREAARLALRAALDGLVVAGPITTAGFHRWLVDQPEVVAGRITTRFLDETTIGSPPSGERAAVLATSAWRAAVAARRPAGPWVALGSKRLTPHQPSLARTLVSRSDGEPYSVPPTDLPEAGVRRPTWVGTAQRVVAVNLDGYSFTFDVPTRSEWWAPADDAAGGSAGSIVAPFPAVVAEVVATPGQAVANGDPIVVIEAMKMLHTLAAHGPGVVAEIRCAPGDNVSGGAVLATFETDSPQQEQP